MKHFALITVVALCITGCADTGTTTTTSTTSTQSTTAGATTNPSNASLTGGADRAANGAQMGSGTMGNVGH